MPTTTIKVDGAVRDRLAQVARARRVTLGALLSDIADQLERDEHWAEIEAAYERIQRDDPAGWADYLAELAEWDAGTMPFDASAAEEWPELNR
jgi:predicted transcriptional regulator